MEWPLNPFQVLSRLEMKFSKWNSVDRSKAGPIDYSYFHISRDLLFQRHYHRRRQPSFVMWNKKIGGRRGKGKEGTRFSAVISNGTSITVLSWSTDCSPVNNNRCGIDCRWQSVLQTTDGRIFLQLCSTNLPRFRQTIIRRKSPGANHFPSKSQWLFPFFCLVAGHQNDLICQRWPRIFIGSVPFKRMF